MGKDRCEGGVSVGSEDSVVEIESTRSDVEGDGIVRVGVKKGVRSEEVDCGRGEVEESWEERSG